MLAEKDNAMNEDKCVCVCAGGGGTPYLVRNCAN